MGFRVARGLQHNISMNNNKNIYERNHVTSVRNGGIYGHSLDCCDEAGCAGAEYYLGDTLSGWEAIERAPELGWAICKYEDPTEGALEGMEPDEAARVAQVDPSLIYAVRR